MAPDKHDTALLLIDVINHLDFEGNEGKNTASVRVMTRTRVDPSKRRIDPSH